MDMEAFRLELAIGIVHVITVEALSLFLLKTSGSERERVCVRD